MRLTMAQALVRWMIAQRVSHQGREQPFFGGVWAIFGHGNVAGLGEALSAARERIPTLRAHNEQAMAHAATAFAKANRRRRVMACTTSIGPGATNMITAAATAHVNRLPLLLLPGDVFASRAPDPVLQQLENFGEPGMSVNDCFRPVSRYFDRILRPEQLISTLPNVMHVLTDPAECGPVTLALPQDVQTEAYDYPESMFVVNRAHFRRPRPDGFELQRAVEMLRAANKPLLVAGGGALYSLAENTLATFAEKYGIPVAETQAGKGALPHDHPCAVGAIGVTGTAAANRLAGEADLIFAVGTRLQDFTTASHTLFQSPILSLNVQAFDARKQGAASLVADAGVGLEELSAELQKKSYRASPEWSTHARAESIEWNETISRVTRDDGTTLPSDAQVLGAVNQLARENSVVVCAAGGLPGELHKLWKTNGAGNYHVEYGYSCMGYEIAGGLGVKLAQPDRDVFVMVGDGSYLMMSSELATSVALKQKLTVVLLDNRGYGCINRLQQATGGESFNNLLSDESPHIDFVAHAASLGCLAERAANIPALTAALLRARAAERTTVIVIETDPHISTQEGGAWWDVAVPEESTREPVRLARADYLEKKKSQRS
jgi:3D-(3,5/4)-trihydroxycyclohexane-1,2-dione acylhydrolase (decyclizing)